MSDRYTVINQEEPRGQSVAENGIPCTAIHCVTQLNRLFQDNEKLELKIIELERKLDKELSKKETHILEIIMIEKNEMSKCMYMQLRLTISDFEKIPQKLICNEIKKAASRTRLVEYSTWREKVMYNGKIMSFTMLVFEVKKNILSNWRGVNGGEM